MRMRPAQQQQQNTVYTATPPDAVCLTSAKYTSAVESCVSADSSSAATSTASAFSARSGRSMRKYTCTLRAMLRT